MDNNHKEFVGVRLKELRKKRNIPVQIIIDKLNIARSTYTGWELGRRAPHGEKLVQLANVFDTTVDYIIGVTDNDDQPSIDVDDLLLKMKYAKFVSNGKELSVEKAQTIENVLTALLKDK